MGRDRLEDMTMELGNYIGMIRHPAISEFQIYSKHDKGDRRDDCQEAE